MKARQETPAQEVRRLALNIARRKGSCRIFRGLETGHDGQPAARFQSTIRGNEWVT